MDMTLNDLIDVYEFDDLRRVFTECYGDAYSRNAEGYMLVYDNLKKRTDHTLNDCVIHISYTEEEDESWHHLSGIKGEESHCLSFTPWAEWLGMKIHPETLLNYEGHEIIIHSMFEMTYYGYNEEKIQEQLEKLNEEVILSKEEIEEMDLDKDEEDALKQFLKHEIESSSESQEEEK